VGLEFLLIICVSQKLKKGIARGKREGYRGPNIILRMLPGACDRPGKGDMHRGGHSGLLGKKGRVSNENELKDEQGGRQRNTKKETRDSGRNRIHLPGSPTAYPRNGRDYTQN